MTSGSPTWRSDVISKLASIETKLDALIASRMDQEQRIRYLEKRNAMMIGACGVVSFGASIVAKHLGL